MRIDKKAFHWILAITTSIGLFVFAVCLLSLYTLQTVNQSEFAVEYNIYTCTFGKVLSQGKYNVAVGTELFKFQRTLQDLNFGEISCLTKDQLIVNLEINMQIQYQAEALIPIILKQHGSDKNFKKFLSGIAKSSVLNSCISFIADDYYIRRGYIDSEMAKNMAVAINPESLGVTVVFFQLTNINFPSEYSSILLQKQTTQQLETTLDNDRLNQITAATTNKFVANSTANIKIINARQSAATIVNQALTGQSAIEAFWQSRAESYAAVMHNFQLTNTSQLIDYINSEIIRTNRKLVTGVK